MNHKFSHRMLIIGLVIILLMAFATTLALAQDPNLIQNGDFEGGFVEGLGVANEWGYFQNGKAKAGFYDDTWKLVVAEGEHAQLLELIDATANDSYAGIYQTVTVVPGQDYQLSFKGLVRSDEGSIDASNYGYRLQYAIDQTGNTDWQTVTDWVELPWDEQPRTGPANGSAYELGTLEATFTATGDSVTIFVRAWKKWADNHEGNYDIDAVRLVPVDSEGIPLPETGQAQQSSNVSAIALGGSVVLILLLVGGAFINQKRRQTS